MGQPYRVILFSKYIGKKQQDPDRTKQGEKRLLIDQSDLLEFEQVSFLQNPTSGNVSFLDMRFPGFHNLKLI